MVDLPTDNRFRGLETPGGPLPFTPAPRCRSESSFSDFAYDNHRCPPAGVASARLKKHKSKQCVNKGQGTIGGALAMDERQAMGAAKERLDGPRRDPATHAKAAGARSEKLTLLLNHDHESDWKDMKSGDKAPRRAQGFILDVPKKGKAICTPVGCQNPLLQPGVSPKERYHRRIGYEHGTARQTWTWNECKEVPWTPDQSLMNMKRAGDGKSAEPGCVKVHTSSKGEKKYNVCGVEDMLPAGTCRFIKSDAPPTSRHIYENDRRELQGFERGEFKARGGDNRIDSSGDTWYCLTNNPRPEYPHLTPSMSSPNFRDMAEEMYLSGMDPRKAAREYYGYAESLVSSEEGSSVYYMQNNRDIPPQSPSVMRVPPGGSTVPQTPSSARRRSLQNSDSGRRSQVSITSSKLSASMRPRWK